MLKPGAGGSPEKRTVRQGSRGAHKRARGANTEPAPAHHMPGLRGLHGPPQAVDAPTVRRAQTDTASSVPPREQPLSDRNKTSNK